MFYEEPIEMLLGIHLMGSDILQSIGHAKDLGLDCFQSFLGSPRRLWSARQFTEVELSKIRSELKSSGLVMVAHAPYVFNLGADLDSRWRQAVGIMTKFMGQADDVGAQYVVVHTGTGSDMEKVVKAARYILSKGFKAKFCLENDCGSKGGTRLGSVKNLILARKALGPRLGICIDTAHAYGAGEQIDTDRWLELLPKIKPDVVHLNEPDPKVMKGGHLDRHNSLFGDGKLGIDQLVALAQRVNGTPCIIECSEEVAIANVELVRTSTLEQAPRTVIQQARIESPELLEELRGQPCVGCGRPSNSIHHIIPLRYWGRTIRENLMPCCLNNGCNGHWKLNSLSNRWCQRHPRLFHILTIAELAELCRSYLMSEFHPTLLTD